MMGLERNFQVSAHASNGRVTSAIQQASAQTGVDFQYLVKQANVESSLNPNAKAKSSSATGLYQFIEQTWLHMVKSYGDDFGYGRYADAIHQKSNGDYVVSNKNMRNTILNLRKDPKASSIMAAKLATENDAYLRSSVGGTPTSTDLYLAHFMGAQGASNFLNSMKKNPWAPAAALFPEAAHANRAVFYQNGKPLSLAAIYNRFDAKFDDGDTSVPVADTQVAVNNVSLDTDSTEVILPAASDWSRPNSIAQRISRSRDMAVFTPQPATTPSPLEAPSFGYLRAPADVLFMAQADMQHYAHDEDSRYNS